MTFATEKMKARLRRFLMARITIGAVVPNASWVTTATDIWRAPFSYRVASMASNGVVYTEQSSPSLSPNQWYQDEAGGYIYVHYGATAPNFNDSIVLVTDYWLWVTQDEVRYSGEDPTTEPTGSREYEPRLLSAGPFSESWENVLAGIVTIGDASITLANADGWLQPHLGSSRSLNERPVDIWICLDSTANARLIYRGLTKSVEISGREATLSLLDAMSALNQPAYMGDNAGECFFRRSGFPAMLPEDEGKPVRHVNGKRSFIRYRVGSGGGGAPGTFDVHIPIELEKAVCTNYTPVLSSTNNQEFTLGRIPGTLLRTQTFGAVQAELTGAGLPGGYHFVRFASHDLIPWEVIKWTNGGTDYYGVVERTTGFTSLTPTDTYNAIVRDLQVGTPTIASSTLVPMAIPLIAVLQNNTFTGFTFPATKDTAYVLSYSATAGGNRKVKITFTNSFWSGITTSFGRPFDPSLDGVYFVMQPAATMGHGISASRLLTAAGMSVDSASVTAADAAVPLKALYTIPNFDESEYRSYREYLADIHQSVGSFTRIGSTGDAEYKVLAAPVGGDEVVAGIGDIGTLSATVDYNDIVDELVPYNPHNPTWEANFLPTDDNPATVSTNNAARYFHKVSTSVQFRHVLETITDRIDYLLDLRRHPLRGYSLVTATSQADASAGDNLAIGSDQIPGGAAEVDVKITGLERSLDSVTIRALELP